jgi:hypothetical protein
MSTGDRVRLSLAVGLALLWLGASAAISVCGPFGPTAVTRGDTSVSLICCEGRIAAHSVTCSDPEWVATFNRLLAHAAKCRALEFGGMFGSSDHLPSIVDEMRKAGPTPGRFSIIACPAWVAGGVVVCPLVLILGTGPSVRMFRSWREHHRRIRKQNRCAVCAYDLTGNTSGVCPECGTRVAKPVPSAPLA